MRRWPRLLNIYTPNPTTLAICIWQLSGRLGLGGSCGLSASAIALADSQQNIGRSFWSNNFRF
ncbi:hypothetical protein [Microcoleus sp. B9-D4]|uniref:hypothetical protein n=1 Tax=Microcoleus sp. B9-D4 TaxID=2818711 RepID=UPI002FCEB9F6